MVDFNEFCQKFRTRGDQRSTCSVSTLVSPSPVLPPRMAGASGRSLPAPEAALSATALLSAPTGSSGWASDGVGCRAAAAFADSGAASEEALARAAAAGGRAAAPLARGCGGGSRGIRGRRCRFRSCRLCFRGWSARGRLAFEQGGVHDHGGAAHQKGGNAEWSRGCLQQQAKMSNAHNQRMRHRTIMSGQSVSSQCQWNPMPRFSLRTACMKESCGVIAYTGPMKQTLQNRWPCHHHFWQY